MSDPMKAIQYGWRISLVLTLLLAACTAGNPPFKSSSTPTKAVCPSIRVGVVIASSDTIGGQEQKEGYELALSEINRAGGVQSCPVELSYPAEGESAAPDSAQIAMLDLVQKDVIAVVGATSTDATKRAAALANYFKIPFLVSSDTGDDITETGTQWLFRVPPQNKVYAAVAFDMVKGTLSAPVNIAVLYEHSEYGESAAVAAAAAALNRDLRLVSYQGFATDLVDYSTIMQNLKSSAADVVYLIDSNPAQAQAMLKAFRDSYLGITMVIGNGSGFTSHDFLYDQSGNLAVGMENLFITVPWSADLPRKGNPQLASDLIAFRKVNGITSSYPPVAQLVEAYTALKITANAINDVVKASPDWLAKLSNRENLPTFRDTLAQSLRTTKDSSRETLLGSIVFDTEGQNTQDAFLIEIIDGKLMTVYPKQYAVHEPVYVKGW